MVDNSPLRVVSNSELDRQQAVEVERQTDLAKGPEAPEMLSITAHIKKQYQYFKWHRSEFRLHHRYLKNLRQYKGEYEPDKLNQIKQFGGSEVYSKLTTVKCRGATALLRDIYVGGVTPWTLDPTPVPSLPEDVTESIIGLVETEAISMMQLGEKPSPSQLQEREDQLKAGARVAARKTAQDEAKKATTKLDDVLREGGFYVAFSEFLTDLPIFPYACIKGPVVKNKKRLKWQGNSLTSTYEPVMTWTRVSAFDMYITPGASKIEDADIIERIKLSRSDLNQCLGLPGYNDKNIRSVLNEYEHGLQDWLDEGETQRANLEDKENPYLNRSELIDTLEFHGSVRGKWLLEWGFDKKTVPDSDRDYSVVAWLIGNYVIKVQINPNPKQRPPYYISSFEKVPGSLYGNSLPETLSDVQDVANASLRSLVNNMGMASGPQVVVNQERMAPSTNPDTMYPWKRWRTVSDPMSQDTSDPVKFFQPQSNSQELLGVYKAMTDIADEVSAIPRYVTGSSKTSGAASTASGLAMLMNNASKVLQNVAAAIDTDVLKPALEDLYNMVMLTDGGKTLRGDEQIVVKGATVAMQKEQDRMRRLEFLQLTANPIDMGIIGEAGRAKVLEAVAEDLGLPHEQIVPNADQMQDKVEAMSKQQELMQAEQDGMAQAAREAQGDQPGLGGGGDRMEAETDNAFRTGIK
jgi:hypothetical protein